MQLESLANLISRDISPELGRVSTPAAHLIDAPMPVSGTEREPHAFELAVFNYFLAHKEPLGISKLWRCRNVRVDGLVDLDDGRRIALEIKYRMNWEKACQACSQFGWYRTHVEPREKPLSGGLVVFESFTADWARKKSSWLLENGWSFFYMDHREVERLRVDLVRLREGTLETFPAALASARAGVAVGD